MKPSDISLPSYDGSVNSVHAFLESLRTEALPELVPIRVLHEIYLEKRGIPHSQVYYQHHISDTEFERCVAYLLNDAHPNALPYVYTRKFASAIRSGKSRLTGLHELCRKYHVTGWYHIYGHHNTYYAGIRYDRKKGGKPYRYVPPSQSPYR